MRSVAQRFRPSHIALASLWLGMGGAQLHAQSLSEVTIVANRPVGNTGITLNQFAGNVQILSTEALDSDSNGLTGQLNQALGSVHVNDTQGNPFSMDLSYRGFSASPVLGTPQGISVVLDGVRINEPFGDVVSWDLLPGLILDKVTAIPGANPVYGLNTLGGALALTSKDGRQLQGTLAGVSTGSFGRVGINLEHGSHDADDSLYLAGVGYHDDGWAQYNPSNVRQLFAKITHSDGNWDSAISVLYADNLLYGNQSVPQSMLDHATEGYSHPDYTATQHLLLNLSGNLEADTSNSYAGNLYLRQLRRDILNSNINTPLASASNDAGCAAAGSCPAANLLAHATQDIVGANLQWSNTDPLWQRSNSLSLGLNLELSQTEFGNRGQNAYLDASRGLVGADGWTAQASIHSQSQRWGIYGTSTLDASEALSITASARFDMARIGMEGWSCVASDLCDSSATLAGGQLTDVSGQHHYERLNPALGMTYLLAPQLIAFASYAEGLRTPSAIELACADPAQPCSGIPNAFGADPHLDAVVSRSVEAGLRGNLGARLKWRTALYQTRLENDILFNQSSLNSGYFSNVGSTLREGLELGIDGQHQQWNYAFDLDWISATYQSPFLPANQANSAATTAVQPGNHIPGIPAWVLKGRLGLATSASTHIGLSLQAQGPSYARGDDNNADSHGPLPGFCTLALDVRQTLSRGLQLRAGIDNLTDQRYASYAVLATNQLGAGVAEQFQSVGAPRRLHFEVQARF